jgi:CRP-like cAMP-binding protein
LIEEGWVARYRLLPYGRRQITALFLPGEFCDLTWLQAAEPDQSVTALTLVNARCVATDSLLEQCDAKPSLRAAVWKEMCRGAARQSDWIVNLGRKKAIERVCHLFCELYYRLEQARFTFNGQCAMPLTQVDLADITGLTPVHVNRTLQELRSKKLIDLRSKWLRILDLDALRTVGLYNGKTDTNFGRGRPAAIAA